METGFSNAYGTMSNDGDTLFYGVSANEFNNPDIRPGAVSGVLKDVSSAFLISNLMLQLSGNF